MEARITNATSVNRIYGRNTEAELMAVFQYEGDAFDYAKAKLAEDAQREWFGSSYIVANSYSGKVMFVSHDPDTTKAAAA